MPKIKIEWTTGVTESYSAVVEYDDFVATVQAYGDDYPTLEQIKDGATYVGGWGDLGAEFENEPAEFLSVDSREIESITIIEESDG